MKLKGKGPQCVCIVLGAALLIFGILAVTGHATEQTWTYKRALGGTADSVIYNVWHGWDSVGTVTDTTNRDSLMFSFTNVQDTTNNWVDAFIFWNGYDSADGDRIFMGNPWVAKETNVFYQIRHRWADPPDTVIRTIRQNYVLVETKIMVGPVYRDYDSILTGMFTLNDTDVVTIVTTECWGGGERTAFEEIVPTATNAATLEIIYVELTDTVYFPDPPSSAQLCRVYGWVGNAQQRTVGDVTLTFSLTENVVNVCDSAVMISTSFSTETNGSGYFYIDLIRSSCLQTINAQGTATGRAKYNVLLDFGGQTKQLRPFTVPDSTTCRLWW